MALPSMDLTIRSSGISPASAAALPSITLPITGSDTGRPTVMNIAQNTTMANRKLTAGPANTMAARWPTVLYLNETAFSSGVSSRGRASVIFVAALDDLHGLGFAEHLHVAAERDHAELPARAVSVGVAEQLGSKADGKAFASHATSSRDEEVAELVDENDDRQERRRKLTR